MEVKKKFDMRSWQKQKDIVCKRFFFGGDGCIFDDDFKAFFCREDLDDSQWNGWKAYYFDHNHGKVTTIGGTHFSLS